MALIDHRGRLFGRLNLIDAFAVSFVLLLIPVVYSCVLLFRTPKPSLTTVTPSKAAEKKPIRLEIAGHDLTPFLKAKVGGLTYRVSIVSPEEGTIELPDGLPAGTYDVVLLDEVNPVATRTNALTVLAPAPPPPPVEAFLRVRFVVRPEVTLRIGDTDGDAVIESVDPHREPTTARQNIMTAGQAYDVEQRLDFVRVTLRLHVVSDGSLWYYGAQTVSEGALLTFSGSHGSMQGWIESFNVTKGVS